MATPITTTHRPVPACRLVRAQRARPGAGTRRGRPGARSLRVGALRRGARRAQRSAARPTPANAVSDPQVDRAVPLALSAGARPRHRGGKRDRGGGDGGSRRTSPAKWKPRRACAPRSPTSAAGCCPTSPAAATAKRRRCSIARTTRPRRTQFRQVLLAARRSGHGRQAARPAHAGRAASSICRWRRPRRRPSRRSPLRRRAAAAAAGAAGRSEPHLHDGRQGRRRAGRRPPGDAAADADR